jgi:exonuclease VII small subunit
MEHFILSCVRAGWVDPLTAAAARWATQLWGSGMTDELPDEPKYLYWDWHVKTVYSDYHVPRTKHGTNGRIVGARKQLMLHDAAGHLLLLRTYRGDTHLIEGMKDGGAYYEGLAESHWLTHQIFDREGLAVAYFKELVNDEEVKRQFTTCLRSNQYKGVESFDLLGSFQPFRYDEQGEVIEEIAEAKYKMMDRRRGEDALMLRAILLRKPDDDETGEVITAEEDDETDDKVRLQVIVTPELDASATEVVERYRARRSKQENAIRDWWLPLGGDVNVGYDKRPVENSELAKEKEALEGRLKQFERYIPACEERLEHARQRRQKCTERYRAELEAVEKRIEKDVQRREARGEAALNIYRWAEAEKSRAQEHLEPTRRRIEATVEKVAREEEKRRQYCEDRQKKDRALVAVTQAMEEHPMYKLDDRKDQLMSALRVFLVNVLQWLRGTVFPESYACATYKTLAPFLQMGGFVVEHRYCIEVFLDGFWQSAKQRELKEIVDRCNAQQFTAPDGRALRFDICQRPGYI